MDTERLKNSKPFCFWDTAVYISIGLLVFVLFLAFVILPRTNKTVNIGFMIEIGGKTAVTYEYGSDTFNVEQDYLSIIETAKSDNGYTLTVYTSSNKLGFNKIFIDETNKTVKMVESDCKSKQCTYLHEINGSGIIYCAPRQLKITPLGGSGFLPPIAG